MAAAVPHTVPIAIRKLSRGLFSLILPDDCRVCGKALENISRIPVCPACLSAPKPLVSEFACARCGTAFSSRFPLDSRGWCAACRRGLWGFDAAYAFGFYEAELRRLVHVFKYEKIRTLAVPLARLLVRALPREAAFDVIVPVPMHWRRRLERGFNQASLLANELGRYVGAPIASALRRPYRGTPQASLSFADRRANLRGASFTVSRPGAIAGRRVLLVDDVITTGATARACARALKSAGAAHVTVLTLARVDRRAAAHADRMRTTAATNGGK